MTYIRLQEALEDLLRTHPEKEDEAVVVFDKGECYVVNRIACLEKNSKMFDKGQTILII